MVENYFAAIRSCGHLHNKPTPADFASRYKSLIINNMVSRHSINANCEYERTHDMVNGLKLLLMSQQKETSVPTTTEFLEETSYKEQLLLSTEGNHVIAKYSLTYVSGYILRKLKPIYKACSTCCNNFESVPDESHSLIAAREVDEVTRLTYPSQAFIHTIEEIKNMVYNLLNDKFNDIPRLLQIVNQHINNSFILACSSHAFLFKEKLSTFTTNFFIYKMVRDINNILHHKLNITKNEKNPLKIAASIKCNKLKKRP